MKTNWLRGINWLLVAIVALGGALRFWGIFYGLPYTYLPDEPSRFNVALNILRTGDLNPHWLGYPHLAFYIWTLVLFVYFLAGRVLGIFSSPADIPFPEATTIGVGWLAMPSEFVLLRGFSALLGTGAIVLLYLIAKRYSKSESVSLLAALWFAVSPAAVLNSQVIALDSFAVFFVLLAFLWSGSILERPHLKQYALAGIGIGLAVSSKYNVVLIILPLLVTQILLFGRQFLRQKGIYVAGLASFITFAICNPFSILDPGGFFYGLTLASGSQSQYVGTSQNSFVWYAEYLWRVEGPFVLFALLYSIKLLWQRSQKGIVLISFPAAYFVFVSLFSVWNDRTILPAIPFLDLLAGLFVVEMRDWLIHHNHLPRRLAVVVVLLVAFWMAWVPLQTTLSANHRLTQSDGRETARRWIEENLPAGSRVAQEGYTPYIDGKHFSVYGLDSMIRYSPDWYTRNGFEYLVFGQGIYGRVFSDPSGFPNEIANYNRFFEQFRLLARFDDNGYEVRIYQTNAVVPPHRVAARFGDYGEMLELVGYDDLPWSASEPLRVKMSWRTLGENPEPFEIELRLLDQDDHQVATVRGDLFQGRGWRSGMFDGEWVIPTPVNLPPGSYRLQVSIIWTKYEYRLPAQTWAGAEITPVLLGPFESKPLDP